MMGTYSRVAEEIIILIVRESVSAFFLLIVLIGGYRLLNKLIDSTAIHLKAIEECLRELVRVIGDFTEE